MGFTLIKKPRRTISDYFVNKSNKNDIGHPACNVL